MMNPRPETAVRILNAVPDIVAPTTYAGWCNNQGNGLKYCFVLLLVLLHANLFGQSRA